MSAAPATADDEFAPASPSGTADPDDPGTADPGTTDPEEMEEIETREVDIVDTTGGAPWIHVSPASVLLAAAFALVVL